MPDLTVSHFGRGLDVRRQEVASLAGALSKAINCHITPGGEIEQRKALLPLSGSLPTVAGVGVTFGLASDGDNLYVFGSKTTADITLPTGINYQRLAHPSNHAMTAVLDWTLYDGEIYVSAQYADGSVLHFKNASRVTDWFDGKARGGFSIEGGAATTTSIVTSIKVNGVEILSATMTLASLSLSEFANTIANRITSHVSSPDYTAAADGSNVTIIAPNSGTTANGFVVSLVASGVSISNITNMANGLANSPGSPGDSVLTLGGKLYTDADDRIHFSADGDATEFTDNGENGAGFIEPGVHSAGAGDVRALGSFLTPLGEIAGGATLVVLARQAIQIWHVEANDDNNRLLQVIGDHGTRARNANVDFKSRHAFLSSKNGIHAIVARDSSNTGAVAALGAAINKELKEYLLTLDQTARDAAVAEVEPSEGRLWMAVGARVYVLSDFPEGQPVPVFAWTRYDPGFTINHLTVAGEKLYARSGNTVYAYGGTDGETYDACTVLARIAYLDAGVPAGYKNMLGVDAAVTGNWRLSVNTDLNNADALQVVANLTGITYDIGSIPTAAGRETHLAVELYRAETGPAVISSFVLHYQVDQTVDGI